MKSFQIHFELKSKLYKDYESVVEAANKKINSRSEYSKFIRKCHHTGCGTIWFKTAGCDGATVCGRLNDNH